MIKVIDIYNFLDQWAPFNSAMDYDNVGILVGDKNSAITKALICLDITKEAVFEANEIGAELIISHHPVIFNPIKNLDSKSVPYMLAKFGISCICAHTNLDMADGGVNTCLVQILNLKNTHALNGFKLNDSFFKLGLVGELENEMETLDFAKYVKKRLNCSGVKYLNINKKIKKVAICSGGAGEFVTDACALNADAFVTGEIKHHEILIAEDNNLVVVDAGHFKTEDIICLPLIEKLSNEFGDIKFIKSKKVVDKISYI